MGLENFRILLLPASMFLFFANPFLTLPSNLKLICASKLFPRTKAYHKGSRTKRLTIWGTL
jgi:hypothetical protein